MHKHVVALSGAPDPRAYEAMATYVDLLPDYASLDALLAAARTWDGPPERAYVEWLHLVVEHLHSAVYRASFVGQTPPDHIPQRFGLLCFPPPPDPEPHAPGTYQVWVTCPFGDSAEPRIYLIFDTDFWGVATYLKEGKRDMRELLLSHLAATRDLQQAQNVLPAMSDEQAAPFMGYEIAELFGDTALDVRFSTIA